MMMEKRMMRGGRVWYLGGVGRTMAGMDASENDD